jgi:hypothetical protein
MIISVVNELFSRLTAGELAESGMFQEGWEVDLPSGRTVARSVLQAEAKALISLGPDIVPDLLPWVMNGNPALRYVALYSLEQITGEKPYAPYFDQADFEGNRSRAIQVWRGWYEARRSSAGATID